MHARCTTPSWLHLACSRRLKLHHHPMWSCFQGISCTQGWATTVSLPWRSCPLCTGCMTDPHGPVGTLQTTCGAEEDQRWPLPAAVLLSACSRPWLSATYLRPWPHHSWVEPSLSLVKSFACEVRVRTGLLMPCCRSAFISEQWISTARTQLFISKIPQISPHTTVSGLVAGTIEKPLVQLPVHAPVPKAHSEQPGGHQAHRILCSWKYWPGSLHEYSGPEYDGWSARRTHTHTARGGKVDWAVIWCRRQLWLGYSLELTYTCGTYVPLYLGCRTQSL